jgi:hypothetical protein
VSVAAIVAEVVFEAIGALRNQYLKPDSIRTARVNMPAGLP